jgi:hypothetical protein
MSQCFTRVVRQAVRGELGWTSLREFGVSVVVGSDTVKVLGNIERPVAVSPQDVATGWMRHASSSSALREWARIIHGAVGLIELDFDDHPLGDSLLDALWRLNFGERPTADMEELARRILLIGKLRRQRRWVFSRRRALAGA